MTLNTRLVNKTPKWSDRDSSPGVKFDTAVMVGIVKNNLDPARAGRLQVFVPDLGGNEDDPSNWKTVNYASPFFGTTYNPNQGQNNTFTDALHSYGMWMVPPDLGNQVLIVFANGDPDRGYWFACVHTNIVSHFMVPGLSSGNVIDKATASSEIQGAIGDTSSVPVSEFNESVNGSINANFINNPKPVHEYQFKRYLQQGLDKDRVRGAITSSSQRESPSTVFGISTPGRFLEGVEEAFLQKIEAGTVTETDFPTGPRRGGHSFVMDDGDIAGVDNLIRLRSSAGHQIIMNDTERVMYISNSEGSVWLEFAENGQMHIFSAGGLNVRTQGDMNLHSDKNININAEGKLNITGVDSINMETNTLNSRSLGKTTIYGAGVNVGSSGDLNLFASGTGNFKAGSTLACVAGQILLNSGGGAVVNEPTKLNVYTHSEASKSGLAWQQVPNSLDSICTVLPTHEPWSRQTGVNRETGEAAGDEGSGVIGPASVNVGQAPEQSIGSVLCEPTGPVVKDGSGKTVTDGSGKPVRSSAAESDPGPKAAAKEPVKMPCPREWLSRPDVPNPPGGIGKLTQYQVKCVMAQMAYSESRFNYALRERTNGNYLGRYQVGAAALVELGYMKRDYYNQYSTRAVRYPDAFLGTDNVKSDEDYLANKGVQEKVMYELMSRNHASLIKKVDGKQGIKDDDDLCTIAGMLCVAQLLGSNGARKWRYTAEGADANGSTGAVYFNRGRYAIDVLANGNQTTKPGGASSAGPVARVDGLGMTQAAKDAAAMNLNPDDYFNFTRGGTGSGSKERFLQTQEAFRAAITGAAMEYKKATGRKLTVNSTIRTAEDQLKLYNAWREAGGKYPREGGPPTVNTPGFGRLSIPTQGGNTGQHGRGLAIDLQPNEVDKLIQLGLVEKYGLQGLGSVDPPHLQYPLSRTPPPKKG